MTTQENPTYSMVWYEVLALAVISAALGFIPHLHALAVALATIAFGVFVGAEQAAHALTADQGGGTMTHFMYLKVGNNWMRAVVGVFLAAIIWWLINRWLGYAFMAWLPWHYSGLGAGPVDIAITWLGHRFGVNIRTT